MLMTLLLVASTALDVIWVPSYPLYFSYSLGIAKTAVLYLPQKQKECMLSDMSGHKEGLPNFQFKLQSSQLI